MELKLDGFSHKLPLLTVAVVQSLASFKVSLIAATIRAYVMGASMLALLAGPGLCPRLPRLAAASDRLSRVVTGG